MSSVELHLYVEPTDSGPVWWSESPQVPGFHATAPDMDELITRSKLCIAEILGDEVEVTCRVIGQPPGADAVATGGGPRRRSA